jgi:UDP-2-acetamido-3-amino-2,3-dideoxy-glucuronate N-acetyltransferase
VLEPSDLAPGLLVGPGVRIGDGVAIGAHVTIHAGTAIGDGCVVEDGAVLGKEPRLARTSAAAGRPVAPLVVGERATLCAGCVVFAGASIGDEVIVGDQAYVRERAAIGPGTVVGRGSAIDNDVTIGARVRIQTDVYVTAGTVVEDDVFLGPRATTTNDDTMNRLRDGDGLRPPVLRRACRIGGGAVLVPGVEVGEEAYVAAGAVVTRDVPPRAVVMGVPARAVRDVPERDLL